MANSMTGFGRANVLIDGTKKVQFKEFLTLNFTYSLQPKKKK